MALHLACQHLLNIKVLKRLPLIEPVYPLTAGLSSKMLRRAVSQALARCGADNILPPGPVAAPLVAQEFVVQANPHVIFFGKEDAGASHQLWSKFPSLRAVKDRRLIALDDPRLARPGPVLLDAVEPLCRQLQPWRVRAKQN